jgi:hypothetical protein
VDTGNIIINLKSGMRKCLYGYIFATDILVIVFQGIINSSLNSDQYFTKLLFILNKFNAIKFYSVYVHLFFKIDFKMFFYFGGTGDWI